ncbi:hypothetical protein AVMA1855_08895 [Acidovorax sp. SUPP1855]|uniref:hypothetical protein n=1 Tax=Acidovorax sp. SUPP1855 TaxID=431774 RepID=UPI0023DE4867|nr:hypothetical protein [Acidovorax sp. SUPP1855]GKS84253.1 hypothetical protein AVMA1855_08895 [Acidovorax sp. SUPP1855]
MSSNLCSKHGHNFLRSVIFIGLGGLLVSCNLSNDESKVWIASSGYKYKEMIFESPLLVAEKIINDPPAKMILVACPSSTPSMIIPLQQILANKTSSKLTMVRENCPDGFN